MVAKGFSQRPGFDFNETFAPTAKWDAIFLVLAIAVLDDLEMESVDCQELTVLGDEGEGQVTQHTLEIYTTFYFAKSVSKSVL